MQLLHVENAALLLVDIRDVDDHLLQVRSGKSLLFQQCSQPIGSSNANVDSVSMLADAIRISFTTYLFFFK